MIIIEVAELIDPFGQYRNVTEASALGKHTVLEDASFVHDIALAFDNEVKILRVLASFFDDRDVQALEPFDRLVSEVFCLTLLAVLREHTVLCLAIDFCLEFVLTIFEEKLERLVDVLEHKFHQSSLEARLQLPEEIRFEAATGVKLDTLQIIVFRHGEDLRRQVAVRLSPVQHDEP